MHTTLLQALQHPLAPCATSSRAGRQTHPSNRSRSHIIRALDDDGPPAVQGDWRAFRAGLISQTGKPHFLHHATLFTPEATSLAPEDTMFIRKTAGILASTEQTASLECSIGVANDFMAPEGVMFIGRNSWDPG